MKPPVFFPSLAVVLCAAGCATSDRIGSGEIDPSASFARVRPVLESNCVHCHGDNRLANMPAFNDSAALARLTGPNNWIVPGHPERSRFFQVVTFTDEQPAAMPPTGHAISKSEVDKLRAWIVSGAQVPPGPPIPLRPRGEAPRSR